MCLEFCNDFVGKKWLKILLCIIASACFFIELAIGITLPVVTHCQSSGLTIYSDTLSNSSNLSTKVEMLEYDYHDYNNVNGEQCQ